MSNVKESARALRIASTRSRFADDASMRSVLFPLGVVEQARADIEAKRQHLEASGHFTAQGIFEKLKELRQAHAKSLETLLPRLQKSAQTLAASLEPTVKLPSDSERILNHYVAATPAKRQHLLNAALSGSDPDLAAVLAHPSSERYAEINAAVIGHLRQRFTDASAVNTARPKLEAHQLVHEVLTETINELTSET